MVIVMMFFVKILVVLLVFLSLVGNRVLVIRLSKRLISEFMFFILGLILKMVIDCYFVEFNLRFSEWD